MADYLLLINGQPNATQRALLKVGLQASQVSDVTIDNAFYHFNQFLTDMMSVSMANVSILTCAHVKYPEMFHLTMCDVKLLIEIDAAWVEAMEASCATLSKLAHIKWEYSSLEGQLDDFSEMYESSEQKADKLTPLIKSLKLIKKIDRHIDRLFSKLEQKVTSRKVPAE
jgi:hypothetical protein